jgi:putative ABC transport system permease protein
VIAGRDFDPEMSTDVSEAFIINETAVKNFGLGTPEEAIGEAVKWKMWSEDDSLKVGRVVGVVADFNFKSLHNEMSSVVIHMDPYLQNLVARLEPDDIHESINQLEASYRTFEPDRPFEFNFIDQTFKKFYESEQKLSWLFSIFTILAIITAGIGLFGSVSFNIISRSREIGIRKVMGAGVNSVVKLLVKRYFILVAICLLVATPLAYIFAAEWLENFSFRVSLDAWIFIEVVIITLLFSIATVGFQAYRGAIANPSEKIRSE